MAQPNTKQEFANWILRRLGAPVVNVEVTNEQLEDCIDEAVQKFQEWHYDGALRSYRVIKVTQEMLDGNKRNHQDLTAPMFNPVIVDTYRIGDRVMTYTPSGAPDKIWVRFDSEERINKAFFTLNPNGDWVNINGANDFEIVNDSDGGFTLYDSETHTLVTYFIDNNVDSVYLPVATPANPNTGYYYTKIGSSYLPYDSDRDHYTAYQVDAAGSFVNINGSYIAYNPATHFTPTYQVSLTGAYVDSDGSYVLYDSDKHTITGTNRDTNQNQDSDETLYALWNGKWYVYDSDVWKDIRYPRQPVLYTKGAIAPIRYNLVNVPFTRYSTYSASVQLYQAYNENLWVDSEGSYVAYDSDKHFVYQYDVNVSGIWTDSDSVKVLYDSDKHVSLVPYVDATGAWVDSDNDKNLVAYDSDIHTFTAYRIDSDGLYADSEGKKVLYDSDRHFTSVYVPVSSSQVPFLSNEFDQYYYKNNTQYVNLQDAFDVAVEYPSYQFTSGIYIQPDSDIQIDINGIAFVVKPRTFTLKGTTETSYDTDGYGNNLSFASLDGLRVKIEIGLGSLKATVYILDKTIGTVTTDPLAGITIRIYSKPVAGINTGLNYVDINGTGTYNRKSKSAASSYFFRNDTPNTRYTAFTAQPIRYSIDQIKPVRYSRQFALPTLFNRRTDNLYNRYSKQIKEVTRTNKSFDEMWKLEEKSLNDPYLDLDYSRVGQVGIAVPKNVFSVTKVFRINSAIAAGMWSYEYQYFLTNFDWFYGNGGGGSMAMTNYYITRTYLEMIDHMLNTQPAIRFNKHEGRLYIDFSWATKAKQDQYLLVEIYERADPETWGSVYNDGWLKKYATALVKKQWGTNLKKYSGSELPGGITINGQETYSEAVEELDKLDEELRNSQLEMDSILIG